VLDTVVKRNYVACPLAGKKLRNDPETLGVRQEDCEENDFLSVTPVNIAREIGCS
jgi:hypothetical protein